MASAEDRSLVVTGLHVQFNGGEACRGVSLEVAPGEVVALLGANGAGKSTTLRTISGINRPTRGTIRYAGRELTRMPAHKIAALGIAHVPEGRALFTRMTVRENLEVGLYRKWPVRASALDPATEMFPELEPLMDRVAFSLSGGEQQMVALARALLVEPAIVMLDEPSLGLAPVVVDRIIATIARMREQGRGVLLVEQDTTVALMCCDRGYVLANGAIAIAGSRDDLAVSDKVSEAYIGSKG